MVEVGMPRLQLPPLKDMLRSCAGVYIWAEGARYEGEYKEHKKHGRGLQTWPTGGRLFEQMPSARSQQGSS